jgi:hypothetical protein
MSLKSMPTNNNTVQQMSGISAEDTTGKVNINDLITRYKKEQAKEKTETIIFVSLALCLIVVSGIIVSL